MEKIVQSREDYFIQFSDQELVTLGIKKGGRFTISLNENGTVLLTPFEKVEIELSDFNRENLEKLIRASIESDESIGAILRGIAKENLKKGFGLDLHLGKNPGPGGDPGVI